MLIRAGLCTIALALIAPEAAADEAADLGVATAQPAPAQPTLKKPHKKRRKKAHTRRRHGGAPASEEHALGFAITAASKAALTAGAFVGAGTLRVSAAISRIDTSATVSAERGRWRLELPIAASHRETIGASLRETTGAVDLAARFRQGPALRLEAEIGLRAYWRPDWPDPYQPMADGVLGPTDRHSHWDRRIGAEVASIPIRHEHARLGWRYTLADHAQDPAFAAIEEPTHLVPGDNEEHSLDASWKHYGDGWKLGGGIEATWHHGFFEFARDAGTGDTHAPAGNPPPNPLFRQWITEPELDGELELAGGQIEIDLGYGFIIADDVYQGYYSYTAHHPAATLAWRRAWWQLTARAELEWRSYGPGSYAAGDGHPPLTDGSRRYERRTDVALTSRAELGAGVALVGAASLDIHRSNFPDYVPGVFPASRGYDLRWSYEDWEVTAGVEIRR